MLEKGGFLEHKEIESFNISLEDYNSKKMMKIFVKYTDGTDFGMAVDHKTAKYFLDQLKFALDTYEELKK